jgi:hypothetical protein
MGAETVAGVCTLRLFVTTPHLEKIGPAHLQLLNDAVQQSSGKLAMCVNRYCGRSTVLGN